MKSTIQFKSTTWFLYVAIIMIGFFQLSSCGSKGNDPTPATTKTPEQGAVQTKMTASSVWKVQSVSVDGSDKTALYSGLTIKFTDTGFTSTGGAPVWPASGTWTFSTADGGVITRDDGLPITVEVTDTILKLPLTWTKRTAHGREDYFLKRKERFHPDEMIRGPKRS